jgi:DNA primase
VFDAVQLEQARVRFDVIASEVPLKRLGRELVGLCPFHKEKSPSFAIVADKGFYHCHGCGAHGTAIDFVMRTRNLDFAEAVEFLLGVPAQRPKADRAPHPGCHPGNIRFDDIAKARSIWAEATTDYHYVKTYLYSRYLRVAIPPTIREHPALWCPDRRDKLPALIAAFQGSSGRVTAVQRIWLEPEYIEAGDPKGARLKDAKKMAKGVLGDGAMRLAKPGPIMGLAEGLETALAAGRLYSTPTWALGGVSRLGYPAHLTEPKDGSKPRRVDSRPPSVWVPDEVRHLFIFGDGNEVGRQVAEFAAAWWNHAWRGTGRRAEAVLPKVGYGDFQDELRVGVIAGAIR